MKQEKIKDKSQYLDELLQHTLLLAGKKFVLLERQVLKDILIDNKSYREVARLRGQNAGRQKFIFTQAFEKLIHAIDETHSSILAHRKMEQEIEEVKAELGILKEKISRRKKLTPKQKKLLDTPVDELNLSERTKNICSRNNIRLLYDLVKLSRRDFLFLRNCGEGRAKEVDEIFRKHGLSWGMKI